MNIEFTKSQTDQLLKDFEEVYKQIYKNYDEQMSLIPDENFKKNTKEYLEDRYNSYLTLANEIQKELEFKFLFNEIEISFNKIYKVCKIFLKELVRIADKSFVGINKKAKKITIKGIKEEHLQYLEKIKILEEKFRKEGIR